MDKVTLLDLAHILAWAGLAITPMAMMVGGCLAEEKRGPGEAPGVVWFFFALVFQLTYGLVCHFTGAAP